MPDIKNLTEEGGVAVVIVGKEFDIPVEYEHHQQVYPIFAVDIPKDTRGLSEQIPDRTKLVILAGKLNAEQYRTVKTFVERKNMPWLQRGNVVALKDTLDRAFPPRKGDPLAAEREALAYGTPVKEIVEATMASSNGNHGREPEEKEKETERQPRGAIQNLVVEHFASNKAHLSKTNAENAQLLFREAQRRNISTTIGSLSQAVSVYRRKHAAGGVPASILPKDRQILGYLDEAIVYAEQMIARLQLVREYVSQAEDKVLESQDIIRKFKDLSSSIKI